MAIWFFIGVTLLALVDVFTFKPRPGGHLSGNGNPALIFVFPLIPICLALMIQLGLLSKKFFRLSLERGKYAAEWVVSLLVIGCIWAGLAVIHANEIYSSLGGRPDNPRSLLAGWPVWNPYTNTVYFNFITFSIGSLKDTG